MNKNKELKKLVKEQAKDKKSFVVYPKLTRKLIANSLSPLTIGELTSLMEIGQLSDKEKLCFAAKHVLAWPKLHFSKVMKGMGQSHTSINNVVGSAEKKMQECFKDFKTNAPENIKEQRDISDKEEIKGIFDEFSGKQDY